MTVMLTGMLLTAGCSSKEEGKTYAIVTKSAQNEYNDLIVQGFLEVIEEEGGSCLVEQPKSATAESQIMIVENLIRRKVDAIAIAANDSDGLEKVLAEAMEQGIQVSTFDSDSNAGSRKVFVNQALEAEVGKALAEAVYDMAGKEGQWAILSSTSQAANQNVWINAMKAELENAKYQDMRLVDIVYGNDDYDVSVKAAEKLLKEHPDLKVICSPTAVGIEAACQVVSKAPDRQVKVTGLGIPSDIAQYVGTDKPCPYLYLWNPREMGRLSAYVSVNLVEGHISGGVGETFTTKHGKEFEITQAANGGSQVVLGKPLFIGPDNIAYWKEKL